MSRNQSNSRSSSEDSFEYDESQSPLLNNSTNNISSEEYNNVLLCDNKKIFGFLTVKSEIYGLIRIACDVIGILVFTASIAHRKPEYLAFIFQYIFWSYIIAPMWQNYTIYHKNTGESISDAHSCIIGYVLISIYGLMTDILDIRIRECTDPRYIPLSIYNDIYMVTHPGKELNPNFPKDMKCFGVARVFLLIYSASSKASFNLIVFYNAIHIYMSDRDFLSKFIAFIALIIALTDLRIYILTSIFGALFHPYMILLTFSLFFPMCSFLLNPSQENPIFIILEFYWRLIVQCS